MTNRDISPINTEQTDKLAKTTKFSFFFRVLSILSLVSFMLSMDKALMMRCLEMVSD